VSRLRLSSVAEDRQHRKSYLCVHPARDLNHVCALSMRIIYQCTRSTPLMPRGYLRGCQRPNTRFVATSSTRADRWRPHRSPGQIAPAARRVLSLSKHIERSPRNLWSVGYITFTGLPHDRFLRPYTPLWRATPCATSLCGQDCGYSPCRRVAPPLPTSRR
jgi:hypothetical protein